MKTPYTMVLAPNASIMTGAGTNAIIVGGGIEGATVIDPGDDDPAFLTRLIEEGEKRGDIRRILITHGHPDHIGGAVALSKRLGITIYAFSRAGTPEAGEELPDGMRIPAGNDTLLVLHTPGHRFDHLSFLLERQKILFAGDLLAGEGSVVIIPPEGDMQHYLNSLARLQQLDLSEIVPAHGPVISDPGARLGEYIAHRLQREQQVINMLQKTTGAATIRTVVQSIYIDVDPGLHELAAWSIEAHLLKLEREGRVQRNQQDGWSYLA